MIRAATSQSVCLTVTLLDGLDLARSGREHSVNFRSGMAFGLAERGSEPDAKARHVEAMVEQMFPTSWPRPDYPPVLKGLRARHIQSNSAASVPPRIAQSNS